MIVLPVVGFAIVGASVNSPAVGDSVSSFVVGTSVDSPVAVGSVSNEYELTAILF